MNLKPYPIIFTDLDGTLLDHHSYSWAKAAPALSLCRQKHVPVVLVSSKTRAEIQPLQVELGFSDPFVVENGGGIFFSKTGLIPRPEGSVDDAGLWKLTMGTPYPDLCQALLSVGDELNLNIAGFSQMSIEKISQLTGLDAEAAQKAKTRDFDEPFIVDKKTPVSEDKLRAAIKKHGFELSVGGRFFHIHGANHKGSALDKLVFFYKNIGFRVIIIVLGDSQNDYSMLKRADYGFFLGQGPMPFKDLWAVKKTSEPGPAGWNNAVFEVLERIKGLL